MLNQFVMQAKYNQWMNNKLYQCAQKLSKQQLYEDRGAFFGSIFNTLNHILLGDIVWLKRFDEHHGCQSLEMVRNLPQINSLDQILFPNLDALFDCRLQLDKCIINWINELHPEDVSNKMNYNDFSGNRQQKDFANLISHLFNHQTHHRGQVTALMNQLGKDVGVTDMPYMPEFA